MGKLVVISITTYSTDFLMFLLLRSADTQAHLGFSSCEAVCADCSPVEGFKAVTSLPRDPSWLGGLEPLQVAMKAALLTYVESISRHPAFIYTPP